jgi:hypothetical protein
MDGEGAKQGEVALLSKGGDFLKRNGRKYDLFLAELLAFWGIVA